MKSTGDLVVIENYSKFRKDIKKLTPELQGELRDGLKEVGGIAAKSAADVATFKFKRNTPGRGIAAMLRKPGAVGVQAKSVTVAAKAKRKASDGSRLAASGKRSRYFGKEFPYPWVHEYGGRSGGNALGPRAFLHPGVDKATPQVMRALGDVIDKTARKAGFQ